MSDQAFIWAGEHFCEPDHRDLYNNEPRRIFEVGYPVPLDELPETFCAVCLMWFTNPQPQEGLGSHPPKKGTTDG